MNPCSPLGPGIPGLPASPGMPTSPLEPAEGAGGRGAGIREAWAGTEWGSVPGILRRGLGTGEGTFLALGAGEAWHASSGKA